MSDSQKPPHLRHESEFTRKYCQRTLDRIRETGRDDPKSQHVAWQMDHMKGQVQHLDRSLFSLPPGAPKFVGKPQARTLQDLLYEVWELNERYVNEPLMDAFVQINGSPEQHDIITRSLDWARGYVARRLPRPNSRDRGCRYRKFLRLYNELVPFLDQVGLVEDSGGETQVATVAGQYLEQMGDFIAWSFFEATWAGDVTWLDLGGRARLRPHEELDVDPLIYLQCVHCLGIYGWKGARVIDRVLRRMAEDLAGHGEQPLPREEELAQIERLADDIQQMRPFLVRNFRPSRAVVRLPGQLVGSFAWAVNDRLGCLLCTGSEEELLQQDHRGETELPLAIDYRGLLTCSVNPWRNVGTHEEPLPFPAISVGRIVLEAVHETLFGFYDQIDVEAILRRWRTGARRDGDEPATAEDETEAIAASIMSGVAGAAPAREKAGRISSSLRLSRLRSILEGRFGCTMRPGKGSELLFYREGGSLAYVGRHKANPEVPAVAVQRILKKLGISVREWLAVSTG